MGKMTIDTNHWKKFYPEKYNNLMISDTGILIEVSSLTFTVIPPDTSDGYLCFRCKDKHGRTGIQMAAKAVADHFVANPNAYPYIRYKDGNMQNIQANNLEWYSNYINYPDKRKKSGKERKPVNCYDRNGCYICSYESITQATRELKLANSGIWQSCNRETRLTANLYWRYQNEEFPAGQDIEPPERNTKADKKAVNQYDKQGHYLHSYESISEASLAVKTTSGNLTMALKRNGTSANYYWRYQSSEYPAGQDICLGDAEMPSRPKKVPVNQYGKDGHYICTYASISEAEASTNTALGNITRACRHPSYIASGFLWRYQSKEFPEGKDIQTDETLKRRYEKPKKAVNCYDSKGHYLRSYASISEAADDMHVSHGTISRACRMTNKKIKNFYWRYQNDEFPEKQDILQTENTE